METMKPLRLGIYAVINGAITYGGTAVPVYDEKVYDDQSPDLYILLSTQSENRGLEVSDCDEPVQSAIDIEIIRRTGSEVSKDTIDDVSADLYDLLIPSAGTAGFSVSGYTVVNIYRESALTQNLTITETYSVLRKIIRFVTTLNKQ